MGPADNQIALTGKVLELWPVVEVEKYDKKLSYRRCLIVYKSTRGEANKIIISLPGNLTNCVRLGERLRFYINIEARIVTGPTHGDGQDRYSNLIGCYRIVKPDTGQVFTIT